MAFDGGVELNLEKSVEAADSAITLSFINADVRTDIRPDIIR